jgi:membrane protein YqaA with SNARE-associated domain
LTHTLRLLLHLLFKLNYLAPFVMGVADSSFLLLPLGNDLVVVSLVVRNRQGYPWYVLAAVCGSIAGTLLLDLVVRRVGEAGVQRVAGQRRFEYLKRKVGQKGGVAVALACLSPPPFPYTALVSTVCALGYPRKNLLAVVGVARGIRYFILGALAIRYGRMILRVANSAPFRWTMMVFAVVCVVGSVLSLMKWFRRSKSKVSSEPSPAPSSA